MTILNSALLFFPLIYGGIPAAPGEFPVSVDLGYCTGTVIGPEMLLTAGHCAISENCVRHPDFHFPRHDIAVCKIPYNPGPYACISESLPEIGETVILQGYGMPYNTLHWGRSVIQSITDYDIITSGRVNIGSTDSGSALLRNVSDRINDAFVVYGVTSRGNRVSRSVFSRVDGAENRDFFLRFAHENDTFYCSVGGFSQ